MKFVIKPEEEGQFLRDYLRGRVKLSARFIKKLTSKPGYLTMNGEHVTVRYLVKSGDVLHIKIPEEKPSNFIQPEELPLEVVYEDDWLLVLDKEAGIPSMPSHIYPSGTIANGLLAYYDKHNLPYTIHIVTRLDKDTSGLMLIAKHQHSHSLLSQMQKEQRIDRYYEAIVAGNIKVDAQTINNRIRRKPSSIIEREVAADGKEAITHFRVIERYKEYTYVSVRLETGRTHQIRVHFSNIGHPLLGDDLYGGSLELLKRQALHCAKLKFTHPFTNEPLIFRAEIPKTWNKLLHI